MSRDLLEQLRRDLAGQAETPARPELRCLIVDDEAGLRRVISFALREMGHHAEECSSIDDMLQSVGRVKPDLIFLDMCLEGSDAVQGIRGLEQQRFDGLVQLMSGREAKLIEDVKRIGEQRSLRMLPILEKPFRPADLKHLIEYLPTSAPGQPDQASRNTASRAPSTAAPRISLREALEKKWLELWYQPKLNIQRSRVEGAEALIRARHPSHGVLPPSSFLPGADEDSLLTLTEFVIVTALRDWQKLSHAPYSMRLAVNAPVSALTRLPIPALIKEHAPKSPRWPGLIIEVTEDEIVKDLVLAQEVATQLSIYNVSLSIDDFGAGYSSFARLKALPFCELKLDRHFVANCATDRTNEGISQTIIDLAHRFGSVAVAEGIENGADLLALFQMGCDIGQGYHLAPPMMRDQLAWTLTRRGEKPIGPEKLNEVTAKALGTLPTEPPARAATPVDYGTPILIVDDQQRMIDLTRKILSRLGFEEVHVTADCEEALNMLRLQKYQLVISDLHMQPTSGLHLLRSIREDEQLKGTSFLLMTGNSDHTSVVAAKHAGADGYLLKPFTAEQLNTKMREIFSRPVH